MQNLGQDDFRSFVFAKPEAEEQFAIVAFLNQGIEKIDALTNEAKVAIEFLRERRTALISPAVTGQIDVRGWVPVDAFP
jgi:type I restriction enzyme S subunit